jgi:hypothetical protein
MTRDLDAAGDTRPAKEARNDSLSASVYPSRPLLIAVVRSGAAAGNGREEKERVSCRAGISSPGLGAAHARA